MIRMAVPSFTMLRREIIVFLLSFLIGYHRFRDHDNGPSFLSQRLGLPFGFLARCVFMTALSLNMAGVR